MNRNPDQAGAKRPLAQDSFGKRMPPLPKGRWRRACEPTEGYGAERRESLSNSESPSHGACGRRAATAPFRQGGQLARLCVGILAPALLLAALVWFLRGGHLICVFHELTGYYCPGCGSGRALRALLHGSFAEAFGYNALFLLLGVPCGVLLVREYLRFVFPGLGLRKAALPAWCGPAALALILLFWLLRNLPGFAFLAP